MKEIFKSFRIGDHRFKKCTKCLILQPVEEFNYRNTTKSGLVARCKKCLVEDRKRYSSFNPSITPNKHLRHIENRYGLSAEDYLKLKEEQNSCCAICGRSEELFKRRLHVDHSHNTGKVRGLLCSSCNTALGKFEDSPDRLLVAYNYLSKVKCK